MNKLLSILFIYFYSVGTILLPLGDFYSVETLPKMYQHCKKTEDKDMTLIDFITDHLLNLDSIFDKHTNGDNQKPHKNLDFTVNYTTMYFVEEIELFEFKKTTTFDFANVIEISNYKNIIYSFNRIQFIFRPPIVA